jgi:hypothetical protein
VPTKIKFPTRYSCVYFYNSESSYRSVRTSASARLHVENCFRNLQNKNIVRTLRLSVIILFSFIRILSVPLRFFISRKVRITVFCLSVNGIFWTDKEDRKFPNNLMNGDFIFHIRFSLTVRGDDLITLKESPFAIKTLLRRKFMCSYITLFLSVLSRRYLNCVIVNCFSHYRFSKLMVHFLNSLFPRS